VIPDFGGVSHCVATNGTFCWDWFSNRWGSTFEPALIQHIELTGIAVGIGFVIAFALAILAHLVHWTAMPINVVTAAMYTIPSLAAFEILVPYTGLGYLTIELALTSYTLLLLYTNILAGLSGVSPDVLDAADGMGLTRFQRLLRVELPLAVPAIVAGLRVAVVTIISLAAIAAYIAPYGLGKPIFDSLANGFFKTPVIAGGGMAIALALLADALFAGLQRLLTPWANARKAA
jgi:osmoprotectant transport system permease protein